MSSAILLMVLNFIGLGFGPTMVGTLSTEFSTKLIADGMESRTYAAQGLRYALVWVTPFFACGGGVPGAGRRWRCNREIKTGIHGARWRLPGRRRDGLAGRLFPLYQAARAKGFPRAILDTDALAALGSAPIEAQIGTVMGVIASLATVVFLIVGLWLVISGLRPQSRLQPLTKIL